MKNSLCLILLISLIFICCGKIDLPEKEHKGKTEHQHPVEQSGKYDTLTVEEVLKSDTERIAVVKGYMVGYIEGINYEHAILGLPQERANTNFLLADTATEQDLSRMIAVRLDAHQSKAEKSPRELLNMFTHPDYFHQYFIILGYIKPYFKRFGIYNIYECTINEIDSSNHQQPRPSKDLPQLDNHARVVIGR